MADIIDEFIVSLGIDAREYNDEIKKYRADRKRLAEEEQQQNRASQDGQSRTVAGLRTLRNETAGFLLMLAGATSVVGFAKDMLTADATTARFAKNVGMSTERVSVWENAIKRVGGTAGEARQALGTLFNIFQEHRLGISSAKSGILAFFGLSEKDLKDPEAALLHIAEVIKTMPRENVEKQLGLLGLSGSIVGLLAGDRGELTKLLASVEAAGVANDESAEAAMSLEEEMAKTAQTLKDLARPAVSDLATAFSELLSIVNDMLGPMGAVRDWFMSIADSNIGQMLSGGDYKNIWDYIGEGVGGRGGQLLQERWGSKGRGGSGGAGIGSTLWGALDMATGAMDAGPSSSGSNGRGRGARNAASVERYFQSKGFSPAQARGIAASVVAEGGLETRTGGGYKGRALGIGQLLGSRRATFLKRYGPNFTFQNELDFMYEEMNNADGQHVAGRIKQSGSSGAIARMMVDQFYRPAKGAQTIGDYQRASRYLREPVGVGAARSAAGAASQSNVTTVGQVNVYTPAANAEGIVRDIRGEMAKRGLVVQAGNGLRP